MAVSSNLHLHCQFRNRQNNVISTQGHSPRHIIHIPESELLYAQFCLTTLLLDSPTLFNISFLGHYGVSRRLHLLRGLPGTVQTSTYADDICKWSSIHHHSTLSPFEAAKTWKLHVAPPPVLRSSPPRLQVCSSHLPTKICCKVTPDISLSWTPHVRRVKHKPCGFVQVIT